MSKTKSIDFISPREAEVYDLYSRNYIPKQMRPLLGITVGCIYKHIENPQTRNKLYNPVAVYRRGIEEGYFPPPVVFRQCIGFDRSKNSKIFMPVYDVCPCCGHIKITNIRN